MDEHNKITSSRAREIARNLRESQPRKTTRTNRPSAKQTSLSFKESFLLQCIISSIIVACFLVLNLVKFDFAEDFKRSTEQAISKSESVESVSLFLDDSINKISEISDGIITAFGFDNKKAGESNLPDSITPAVPTTNITTNDPTESEAAPVFNIDQEHEIKIDTDILTEIEHEITNDEYINENTENFH